MTAVPTAEAPPGTVALPLPRTDLAPGARRLDVTAIEGGLALGHDSIGLSVVPVVTGPAVPLASGAAVDARHRPRGAGRRGVRRRAGPERRRR